MKSLSSFCILEGKVRIRGEREERGEKWRERGGDVKREGKKKEEKREPFNSI